MSGDDGEAGCEPSVRGYREALGHVRQASFFLAGKGLCLPVRLVKKINRFARRVLAEPGRRLCP